MSGTKGMTPNKITHHESRTSIRRRYEEGEPLLEIAADYGVCTDTIRKVAVDEGAKPRKVGRPKSR